MGTAKSVKQAEAPDATAAERRALSGAQVVAGVFVLIFVFGLIKSLW